ncbi:transporter substrate-binding domain-containing protein [Actinotalea sp. BY-33]|uniref:Transporter substrate-binding domain-containing protein n=1 Tax=Actinotalea soli TaxID=2819234 RepID=A0A939LN92_9CELL|nr:transporter substrate-binding domain-containing protein [Actinotalea soli]MBO1751056.1 transporter substrate-binding domain-containing protein [Actinotalea soli]
MTSNSRRNRALTAGVSILALGLLGACSGDADTDANGEEAAGSGGGALAAAQEAGTITVGIAGEEPYSFLDENGELSGAVIALHEEVFAELGIDNVEGQLVEWDSLIPGLNAGRFDAISAGMSILPDRCDQAAFSIPEIMYTTALLVPEGNPMDLHDMQDVAEAEGITFSAMSGAIEDGYASDLGVDVMAVGSPSDGLDAVVSGRADVFALTGISLRALAENNPDAPVEVTDAFVAVVDGKEQVGAGATVFREGDDDLREAYNEASAQIIGDTAEFERVLGPYGFSDAERPTEDITTEMLCAGELPDAE